jgi:hypothetical protein
MASDETAPPAARKDAQEITVPPLAAAAGMMGSADIAVFNNEIEILIAHRLPQFDKGPAAAYAARRMGESKSDYFAMICVNDLTPQTSYAPLHAGITNAGLVRLVSYGLVFWPPVQAQRYVFIYENAMSKPLIPAGTEAGLGWKPDFTMSVLIRPMISLLADMRQVGFVHGCINAGNIFYSENLEVPEKVLLGESLSVSPSFAQPMIYETLERAMADPAGRGPGMVGDDLYALGVTIACCLRHKNPLEGISSDAAIHQKISAGSFVALTGKERFSGSTIDLVRGLLFDDANQRWTLDEVLNWLEGQRLTPRQGLKSARASRPIPFNGGRYLRADVLAIDLFKNTNEALQMVENDSLMLWVERTLEDEDVETRLSEAVESLQDAVRGPGHADRVLARVSIALYPELPIQYRGLKFFPEGYPYALAHAVYNRRDLAPFAEVINQQFVIQWANSQRQMIGEMNSLPSRFDSCRAFLRQTTVGYGIERCLYYLNPDAPCMSEQLKGFYVRSPDDLLRAYEQIATRPNRPSMFIDRHIAAFLSVKERKVIDPYLGDLNASEHFRRILGNLKCFATIQQRGKIEALPNLCAWMADLLKPVYERFHDRGLREKMREKVDKMKKGGDLTKIAALIDNAEVQQQDFMGFQQALHEFGELRHEYNTLEAAMNNPVTFGRETGHEISAVVSGALSAILIVIFAILYFSHHMVVP